MRIAYDFILTWITPCELAQAEHAKTPGQRNIILIISHGHRYDATGLMKENQWAETPNLVRLGKRGSAYAKCFCFNSPVLAKPRLDFNSEVCE